MLKDTGTPCGNVTDPDFVLLGKYLDTFSYENIQASWKNVKKNIFNTIH